MHLSVSKIIRRPLLAAHGLASYCKLTSFDCYEIFIAVNITAENSRLADAALSVSCIILHNTCIMLLFPVVAFALFQPFVSLQCSTCNFFLALNKRGLREFSFPDPYLYMKRIAQTYVDRAHFVLKHKALLTCQR